MQASVFIAWVFSTDDKEDSMTTTPSFADKVYCFSLSLVCTSIFCLNLTVIILYALKKNLQKKIPNFMLCHSSIIGTFNGVTFNVVLLVPFNHLFQVLNPTYIKILQLLGLYSVSLTVTSLLFMVLERYIAVTKRKLHADIIKKYPMKAFAVILWVLSAVLLSIYSMGKSYIIIFTLIVLIECFCIVILLHRSFTVVRKIIETQVEEARQERDHNKIYFIKKDQERDRRFFRILIGNVVMFITCFLPWAMVTLTYIFFPNTRSNGTFKMLARYSIILYLGSAVASPIFTLTLKDDYKNLFTKFWQRKRNKTMECEQNTPSAKSTSI